MRRVEWWQYKGCSFNLDTGEVRYDRIYRILGAIYVDADGAEDAPAPTPNAPHQPNCWSGYRGYWREPKGDRTHKLEPFFCTCGGKQIIETVMPHMIRQVRRSTDEQALAELYADGAGAPNGGRWVKVVEAIR